MKIQAKRFPVRSFLAFYWLSMAMGIALAQAAAAPPADAPAILNRDQAAAILPPAVFFRGQSASIQARNSAGLRLAGGKLVLAALVDTSGYSSAIQQTYQAYLITEVPLTISGRSLPPGAYGFGFVSGEMVAMDLGGNQILSAATTRDAAIVRPTPLQVLSIDGSNRLYLGRDYVVLTLATQ